jgi:hypothetical protein
MVHFHHLAVENSGPEDQGQLRPELSGHHVFFFFWDVDVTRMASLEERML